MRRQYAVILFLFLLGALLRSGELVVLSLP